MRLESLRQPGRAIDGAIDHFRIEREDTARRIHHAARDGPAEKFVNPIFVVAGLIKRAQPRGPDVRQPRVLHVEEPAERRCQFPQPASEMMMNTHSVSVSL